VGNNTKQCAGMPAINARYIPRSMSPYSVSPTDIRAYSLLRKQSIQRISGRKHARSLGSCERTDTMNDRALTSHVKFQTLEGILQMFLGGNHKSLRIRSTPSSHCLVHLLLR
jgi:hypothetical protein